MSNRNLVPLTTNDWFNDMSSFYSQKHTQPNAPIFSSLAAERFPEGWHAAFKAGVWDEEGEYGDNFRKYFGLQK